MLLSYFFLCLQRDRHSRPDQTSRRMLLFLQLRRNVQYLRTNMEIWVVRNLAFPFGQSTRGTCVQRDSKVCVWGG